MFSFKLHGKDERYVPPHAYLTKEAFDPEQAEAAEAMDTNPTEEAPFEQFTFSASRAHECFVPNQAALQFRRELIPATLLPLNPDQSKALESVDAITADQKTILGAYTALPLPVHRSPVITLFLDNVPPKALMPKKERFMSWWQSAFQLRSMAFLAYTGAVPYHSSVSSEYPRECYEDEYYAQIQSYEDMHRVRVEELIESSEAPDGEHLKQFVHYCEDFALYYLHTLERYIFKVLIEPHLAAANSPLTLEHFLTPSHSDVSLTQCENLGRAQKCVADFFAFHVFATHLHEKRHAGDDYVQRNDIRTDQILNRITSVPLSELHAGYLDKQTAQEYWMFRRHPQ